MTFHVGDLVQAESPTVKEVFVVASVQFDDRGGWVSGDSKGYGVRFAYLTLVDSNEE